MEKSDTFIKDLYANLQALSKTAFPKKCSNCGRIFETEEDFVLKTRSCDNQSGLKSSLDEEDQPIVELFRNCVCGSTLMDFFSERRDLSEQGIRRRQVFGKLLVMLEEKGLSVDEARQELLKFMKGKRSQVLENLGIKRMAP